MSLTATLHKKVFRFNFDARTSRGAMRERTSWFLELRDDANPVVSGIGECPPLAGLSPELDPQYEARLEEWVSKFNTKKIGLCRSIGEVSALFEREFPDEANVSSLVFALETAMLDLANGGKRLLFNNSFVQGKAIPINGLIWMGGMDFMLQQIEIKIRDGFRCIKLKVGGLDFEKECDVLQYVRRKYFRETITIRLDANGAFRPDDALYKLQELARFNIHSIEQPLKKGSEFLPELCAKSPIPVALDEELIGAGAPGALLDNVKPKFLVLKPALHGGLSGTARWIAEAEKRGIGWWITSALESNIGLNAIAQFLSDYPVAIPQGLGTGGLYENNFQSPLEVQNQGNLVYGMGLEWEITW